MANEPYSPEVMAELESLAEKNPEAAFKALEMLEADAMYGPQIVTPSFKREAAPALESRMGMGSGLGAKLAALGAMGAPRRRAPITHDFGFAPDMLGVPTTAHGEPIHPDIQAKIAAAQGRLGPSHDVDPGMDFDSLPHAPGYGNQVSVEQLNPNRNVVVEQLKSPRPMNEIRDSAMKFILSSSYGEGYTPKDKTALEGYVDYFLGEGESPKTKPLNFGEWKKFMTTHYPTRNVIAAKKDAPSRPLATGEDSHYERVSDLIMRTRLGEGFGKGSSGEELMGYIDYLGELTGQGEDLMKAPNFGEWRRMAMELHGAPSRPLALPVTDRASGMFDVGIEPTPVQRSKYGLRGL